MIILHYVGVFIFGAIKFKIFIHQMQLIVPLCYILRQVDSTYMFNVEGLIPKLCQLAQEVGEDDRGLHVRSAALQALASMVLFLHESHACYPLGIHTILCISGFL